MGEVGVRVLVISRRFFKGLMRREGSKSRAKSMRENSETNSVVEVKDESGKCWRLRSEGNVETFSVPVHSFGEHSQGNILFSSL